MKRWFFLVFLVIVIGGSVWWFLGRKPSSPSYQVATIDRGTISQTISATGNVEYAFKHYVYAKTGGIVTGVFVSAGDRVKAGTLLATIDDTDIRLSYEKKKQSLIQASNNLISAKQTYDYTRTLYERQFSSFAELETARFSYENALATYQTILLDMKESQQQLSSCRITSPVDGIVAVNNLKTGTNITVSPFLAFVIASRPEVMQIQALVSEVDISSIRKGQKVRFTVSAFQDTFEGRIEEIWHQPQSSQDVVYYPVIIRADNFSRKLLPGMSATIEIIFSEKENVLRVPSRALRLQPNAEMMALLTNRSKFPSAPPSGSFTNRPRRNEGFSQTNRPADRATLWIINTNTGEIRPIPVRTGLSDGQYTEIIPLNETEDLEGKTFILSLSKTKQTTPSRTSSSGQNRTFNSSSNPGGGMPAGGNTPPPPMF